MKKNTLQIIKPCRKIIIRKNLVVVGRAMGTENRTKVNIRLVGLEGSMA